MNGVVETRVMRETGVEDNLMPLHILGLLKNAKLDLMITAIEPKVEFKLAVDELSN